MVNVAGLAYFMPIFSFLFVFVIMFAMLKKTNLLTDSNVTNGIISVIVASMFVTFSSVRVYLENVVPWFAVLAVALFFILLILGFSQQKIDVAIGGEFGKVFAVMMILIFFFVGIKVFSNTLMPFFNHITGDERVFGSLLITFAGIASVWLVTKK